MAAIKWSPRAYSVCLQLQTLNSDVNGKHADIGYLRVVAMRRSTVNCNPMSTKVRVRIPVRAKLTKEQRKWIVYIIYIGHVRCKLKREEKKWSLHESL